MTIFRGTILFFTGDPDIDPKNMVVFEDGYLETENGLVKKTGSFSDLSGQNIEYTDYSGKIICPGFIDTHLHLPQVGIIASYGEKLLNWLRKYAFPEEIKFSDRLFSDSVADFFIDELLKNGTTTALVMPTVHKHSVDSLFKASIKKNMRMISGKVMMDRNAPFKLLDTPESSFTESKDLIDKWHKKERLLYAVSPRFAITSSEAQLEKASELLNTQEGIYLHTHISENPDEIKKIKELFKDSRNYLDVYDSFSLIGEKTVLAHGVYLEDAEYQVIAEKKASVSFCPSSNLFLGSGLFDMHRKKQFGLKIGIATDVGAGTSLSILRTLSDAYKVCQLQNYSLSPSSAFYLATLGGAETLGIDHFIGSFRKNMEADFVVLDPCATDIMKLRYENSRSLEEILFSLLILGDERSVSSTYIMGEEV